MFFQTWREGFSYLEEDCVWATWRYISSLPMKGQPASPPEERRWEVGGLPPQGADHSRHFYLVFLEGENLSPS